jgi:uncharacterized protein (TIGR02266 family)
MSRNVDEMIHPAERRQHPRVGINWPVRIETDQGSFEGVAVNISSGGAFIHSSKSLKLNDVFRLTIYPRPSDRIFKVRADVVWSDVSGTDDYASPVGMGIRFIDISEADQELISNMVLDYLKSAKEEESDESEEISIIELAEVE